MSPTPSADAAATANDEGAARPGAAGAGEAPPRSAPGAGPSWRRQLRCAALGALALVFIALAGLPVGLDARTLIEPVLSLGYLSLLAVPLASAYVAGREAVLEGMAPRRRDWRDAAAGAATGAASAVGLCVLIALLDAFDLRDPLVNWSPQTSDLLTWGLASPLAMLIWLALGAVLGAAGGALHLAPVRRQRASTAKTVQLGARTLSFSLQASPARVLMAAALTLGAASLLESLFTDLLQGFGVGVLADAVYAPRGGLTLISAALLTVLAALAAMTRLGSGSGLRARLASLPPGRRTRANVVLLGTATLAMVVLPFFLGKLTNELLANVGLFVLLALGLNIVVGLAGILDLGYVAFYAVGGYTAAVLTSPNSPGFSPQLPWWVAVLAVVVMAALVGLLIGTPVMRMRGDYLAIVTLGFGEIIRLLFLSDWLKGWFGGAQGITNIPPADFGVVEVKGSDPRSVFLLVLAFCAVAVYVSWRLERSRLGRAWMAIREDESVAEAMGVDTVSTKLWAFVVGAVLASFSGAIFAAKVGSIFPTSFMILVSIIILVVVIVGGMGNIAGVIVGAVVLIGVMGGPKQPGLLAEFSQFKLLIYGALLIWMMLKRPEGLLPSVRRSRELHQDELRQDAWLTADRNGDENGGSAGAAAVTGAGAPDGGSVGSAGGTARA